MASKGQLTGMRGVYLVASELSRLGFIASPTSRSALGADLLVTNCSCSVTFSVQVKTNASSFYYWLVNAKALDITAKSHIYVLVNVRRKADVEKHEYFVVPSRFVAANAKCNQRANSTFYSIQRATVEKYRDAWHLFGDAT